MTAEQVIAEIRRVMAKHVGDEAELLDALLTEADGWQMRLEEIEDVDEAEDV